MTAFYEQCRTGKKIKKQARECWLACFFVEHFLIEPVDKQVYFYEIGNFLKTHFYEMQ